MRLRFPVGNVRTSTIVLAVLFVVGAVTYLMAPIPESVLRERSVGTQVQTEPAEDEVTPTEPAPSPTETDEPTPDPSDPSDPDADAPTPGGTSPDETPPATSSSPSGTSGAGGDPEPSP